MRFLSSLLRRLRPEKFQEMVLVHEVFVQKYGCHPGAYLEFGVFNGDSALAFNRALSRHCGGAIPQDAWPMYLFDSFVGLPETTDPRVEHLAWQAGEFDAGGAESFIRDVTARGLRRDRYECIPGFYEDSLPDYKLPEGTKAAIVNIDCDLYRSTRVVLEFLRPYLQSYTLLYFDDTLAFAGHPRKGQMAAIAEFNSEHDRMGLTPCPFFTGRFEDRIYWAWQD